MTCGVLLGEISDAHLLLHNVCHELEQRNTAKVLKFLVDVCVKYNISPEIAEMSREKISIP